MHWRKANTHATYGLLNGWLEGHSFSWTGREVARGELGIGSVEVFASDGLLESFLPIDGIGGLSFGLGLFLCLLRFVHLLLLGDFLSDSLSLSFGEAHELGVVGKRKEDVRIPIIHGDLEGFLSGAFFRSPFAILFLEHFLPYLVILGEIVGVSIALNKEGAV